MQHPLPDPTPRAARFADLHARDELFLLPNPWCGGSARLLEDAGFDALATTGAGAAFMGGVRDRHMSEAALMRNIAEICAATRLPVTADMQDGFGETPQHAARAVMLAAEAGAVGCSIEDASARQGRTIYSRTLAAERVQAAVEAARRLPFPFVVTARCDNFFEGIADLDDTLWRLSAYERAGAHALYAPGLTTCDEVREVVGAVCRPVNVLLHTGAQFDVPALRGLGVRRVSVGAYLARVALDAMLGAAQSLRDGGTLSPRPQLSGLALNELFERPAG